MVRYDRRGALTQCNSSQAQQEAAVLRGQCTALRDSLSSPRPAPPAPRSPEMGAPASPDEPEDSEAMIRMAQMIRRKTDALEAAR